MSSRLGGFGFSGAFSGVFSGVLSSVTLCELAADAIEAGSPDRILLFVPFVERRLGAEVDVGSGELLAAGDALCVSLGAGEPALEDNPAGLLGELTEGEARRSGDADWVGESFGEDCTEVCSNGELDTDREVLVSLDEPDKDFELLDVEDDFPLSLCDDEDDFLLV